MGTCEFHELLYNTETLRGAITHSSILRVKMTAINRGKTATITLDVPIESWINTENEFVRIGNGELYVVIGSRVTLLVVQDMCYINTDHRKSTGRILSSPTEIECPRDIKDVMVLPHVECRVVFKFGFGRSRSSGTVSNNRNMSDIVNASIGCAVLLHLVLSEVPTEDMKDQKVMISSTTVQKTGEYVRVSSCTEDDRSTILVNRNRLVFISTNKYEASRMTTRIVIEVIFKSKEVRMLDCCDVGEYINDIFATRFHTPGIKYVVDESMARTTMFTGKLDKIEIAGC